MIGNNNLIIKNTNTTINIREIKYIDLCSGIGGFRVALNNLSDLCIKFTCILSADIKQDAIDTYNSNFDENNKVTDIYTLKSEEIEPFELLCAGFPCQPFSSAGQKKGFSDKRGGMIFKIIELCKYHKPKYVILENVYNLMTLEKGKYIKKIKELFENLGYIVNYKKFNSCNFGCPQSRERVFIICTLEININLELIKTKPKVYLHSILDNSIETSNIDKKFSKKLLQLHKINPIFGKKISDKRGGKNNIHSWDIDYNGVLSQKEKDLMNKILLERRKKHWAKKKNIKWMDGMPLTYNEIKTFCGDEYLQDMLNNLVEKKYLRLEKPKDLINGKREYKDDCEEGYNICKGKLSFPISMILDPNNISPTLTATDSHKLSVIINNKIIRKLTINEMKKICGFPDTFIIPEHVNYYNLFGNMATPPVMEAIFRLIFQ
jgi:DNA (cytosine-5)-methyltransferase 1